MLYEKYTTSSNTDARRRLLLLPFTLQPQSTTETKESDQPRKKMTKKQKCASHINKAEDGYDIGTHAVEKHPVNNILRLKEGLPVRLNMIG